MKYFFFFCLLLSTAYTKNSAIVLGFGVNDPLRKHHTTGECRIEYRSLKGLLQPIFGSFFTAKKAFYAYGGLGITLPVNQYISIFPSFGGGFYQKGHGKDLGSSLEFRSSLEILWKLNEIFRVGIYFSHLSNAGLGTKNPGLESCGFFTLIAF